VVLANEQPSQHAAELGQAGLFIRAESATTSLADHLLQYSSTGRKQENDARLDNVSSVLRNCQPFLLSALNVSIPSLLVDTQRNQRTFSKPTCRGLVVEFWLRHVGRTRRLRAHGRAARVVQF
jgi:hypothetical protein